MKINSEKKNHNHLKTNVSDFCYGVLFYSYEYFKVIEKHHPVTSTWKFSGL